MGLGLAETFFKINIDIYERKTIAMKKLLKKHLIQCDKKLKKLFLERKSDKKLFKNNKPFSRKNLRKICKTSLKHNKFKKILSQIFLQ